MKPRHDDTRHGADEPASNERAAAALDEMIRLERKMPDEEWATETLHLLADLVAEIQSSLTDEQLATLHAVGATLARYGKREANALVEAWQALGMIRPIENL